jgi:hypothetical protein
MWVLRIAACEASIALFEPGDRLIWRYYRLVGSRRIGGPGKLVAGKETDRDGKERKEYLCYKCFFQVSLERLLFIIEIKAVQNAMGKRGYHQGCDADEN